MHIILTCWVSVFLQKASVSTIQLWISGILAILRVLISQSTEDIVLSRIQELSFSPNLLSCQTINRLRNGESTVTTTNEQTVEEQSKYLPEETLSRYVLLSQSISLVYVSCLFMIDIGITGSTPGLLADTKTIMFSHILNSSDVAFVKVFL